MTGEELDFMIQEITMGMPKEQSTMIRSVEASVTWDQLESEIEEIKMRGNEVEIPFETPSVDVIDQTFITEPVE
jgi:hypothetical protein